MTEFTTWRSLVDGAEIDVIPDSGLLHHYDWSDDSTTTTTVPDLQGNEDLTGAFSDLNGDINGVQAGTFDGTDDVVTNGNSTSQPIIIFFVIDPVDTGDITSRILNSDNTRFRLGLRWQDDNYNVDAGESVQGGSPSDSPQILVGEYDGSNSSGRLNGSEILSGDAGSESIDGYNVGNDGQYEGLVGEILVYDKNNISSISEVEDYLSNKWGITLA